MSTRRAQPGAELSQEKFASSGEFERGLIGSMVARRCSVTDDPKDRELIWFVQLLSHRQGLNAIASALLSNYPEQLGTREMVKLGKRAGQSYTAEQVRKIRDDLPAELQRRFLLRGETLADVDRLTRQADNSRRINALLGDDSEGYERRKAEELAEAAKNPNSYAVDVLTALCRTAAERDLEDQLRRLCLDPAFRLDADAPWYFAGLVDALRSHFAQWTEDRAEGLVVTAVGNEIVETLEYTAYGRCLTLIEGNARIGKTFAARAWCELHPGQARFVEVPTGNDDTGFFRALARGLGLGNFAQYKAIELRERVESVLLTGDLLLVLDEAHRLWPQQIERRYGFPKRINWIMSMANQGVPICCVSTPQFLEELKAKEKGGWNSAQLQGRLGQYKPLPADLSLDDLMNVAGAQLPEADTKTLRALADYARTSARYLAAIETIAKRARFIAGRAGRDTTNAGDVRRGIQESVIPSDSQLVRALESKRPAAAGHTRRTTAAAPQLAGSRPAGTPLLLSAEAQRSQIEAVETNTTHEL